MDEIIAQLNAAGQAFLIADMQLAECRRLGRMGQRVRAAQEAQSQAREQLVTAFRASGYTVAELEYLQDDQGQPALVYGVTDCLKRFV